MGKKLKEIRMDSIVDFLKETAVAFELHGDFTGTIVGFSSLSQYKEHTITWLKDKKAGMKIPAEISLCVMQQGIEANARAKIICSDSKKVFFSILEKFWGETDESSPPVGKGTVIGEDVQLGENVYIGCNCSIQGDIQIGDNTVIGDNVVIKNRVVIGNGCDIQSLSVIGEDGYGYFEDRFHVKTMVKHYGGVVIGDNVFIGSHTNIARGTIDDTVIGKGVKIAPSTHIGHNNCIGENAAIICSKLFGSVGVGENTYITSSVIRNQTKVGSNVIIGMGSVVTKDAEDNKVLIGIPAKAIRENTGNEKL